jgi:hypothetical protein
MSIGIIELVLVFGAVLALAVIDLRATKRGKSSMARQVEVVASKPKSPSRKATGSAKTRPRKPRGGES